jgi:formylglycine-generating enzyme required for sulfatase activity
MVALPAGSFDMGASDDDPKGTPGERPRHRVTIERRFAIGRYEVTVGEWHACQAAGRCDGLPAVELDASVMKLPMNAVTRSRALAYVAWLSEITGRPYRLPSESEWEYAARGGTDTIFSWGQEAGKGNARCRDCGVALSRAPVAVGSFRPNGFGLHDMAGNVEEQVADCWHGNYVGAPADGTAWEEGGDCRIRVLRGGSFVMDSWSVRSSTRGWLDDGYAFVDSGLRVALSLD